MMFLICLPASLNVRTEPQSEIGRNRGEKKVERHAKQMTSLERAVSRNGLAQRAKSPISLALRAVDIFEKRLHR